MAFANRKQAAYLHDLSPAASENNNNNGGSACFSNVLTGQTYFRMFNQKRIPRHAHVQAIFRERILKKFGLYDMYVERNTTKQHSCLVVAYKRRSRRRILNLEYTVSKIKQTLHNLARPNSSDRCRNPSVIIVDHEEIPVKQQIEIAIKADIVFALHGAALSWSIFTPPTTVVIEIKSSHNPGLQMKNGVNMFPNIQDCYGSLIRSNSIHHVGYLMPTACTDSMDRLASNFHIESAVTEELIRSAVCLANLNSYKKGLVSNRCHLREERMACKWKSAAKH